MLPKEYCGLHFDKPIKRWDEALPLGNGESGCLIWGESDALRFSLDRTDIWDETPSEEVLAEDFNFETLVKLAKAKEQGQIEEKFEASYGRLTPTKLPAGKLIFDFGESETIISDLDIAEAQAHLVIKKEDRDIEVDSFLHAENKAGFIRIKGVQDFGFHIQNPEYNFDPEKKDKGDMKDFVNAASLELLTYEAPFIKNEGDTQYFIQKIGEKLSYGIFAYICKKEDEVLIVYKTATSQAEELQGDKIVAELKTKSSEGYEKNLASHKEWWAGFWGRSSVSIPDEMFEKNWYLTNYLLGSCSRKGCLPMPLQGVWTADDGFLPPWKGDYHHDLNTQMCYYNFLKSRHFEEGESFVDFLWNCRPAAKKFAKEFYHADGICLPSVMSLGGVALGGWAQYSYQPTNQIWLCQVFERYARYTGNQEFLRERAYPYLKETAEFMLCILKEDEKGKLYLPVSAAPEIHDNTSDAWVTPNSNYDLALMIYLFESLERFAEIVMPEEKKRWREVLGKLPELAVNEKNVLKISPDEDLKESHRHFSHLMAIHPLWQLDYYNEKDKEIIDASILDLEYLGTGYWVGFSFAWMSELYAVQKNGEGAAFQLELFWRHCCSPNGFHLNGDFRKTGITSWHYRPFTLEGNMCAADAVQEMLLYSENGCIELFPAIPERFRTDISFENFAAEKGVTVSAHMQDGVIRSLKLKAKYPCDVKIYNWSAVKHLKDTISGSVEELGDYAIVHF